MHLHTYHISTDRAHAAKPARQTAAVNPPLDLRRPRTPVEAETNVVFMVGVLEREDDKPAWIIDAHQESILLSRR